MNNGKIGQRACVSSPTSINSRAVYIRHHGARTTTSSLSPFTNRPSGGRGLGAATSVRIGGQYRFSGDSLFARNHRSRFVLTKHPFMHPSFRFKQQLLLQTLVNGTTSFKPNSLFSNPTGTSFPFTARTIIHILTDIERHFHALHVKLNQHPPFRTKPHSYDIKLTNILHFESTFNVISMNELLDTPFFSPRTHSSTSTPTRFVVPMCVRWGLFFSVESETVCVPSFHKQASNISR